MNHWRLINSGFQSGAENMALDEALLHSVSNGNSSPVLRFYRWKPATMTLGYAQSVQTDLDLDVCRDAGIDIVRRSTGGRAVLHDNEVTYSVIAPLSSGAFGNTVLDCYRVISEVLQKALSSLGLQAQLVPGKPLAGQKNLAKAVCFSAPSQYELVIDGCKVAGSAQKRFGQAFLQHGSIPVELDLNLLGRALRADVNREVSDSLNKVGWLNRYSERSLAVSEVEETLAEVFSEHLNITWEQSNPTVEEMALSASLNKEKFGNKDWNFRR